MVDYNGRRNLGKVGLFLLLLLIAKPLLSDETQTAERLSVSLVEQILAQQQAEFLSDINTETVSEPLLEALGRAVMEEQIGNGDWHSQMNLKMGGEGSVRLRELHIGIGKMYCERGGKISTWRHSVMKPGMLSVNCRVFCGFPLVRILVVVLVAASVILIVIVYRRKKNEL
jgi:hypothetical protein